MEFRMGILSKDHSLLGFSYHKGKALIRKNNEEKKVTFHEFGLGFVLFHMYITIY